MASGERTRIGEGGALVPYSARTAAGSAMRDPRGAAGYYGQQLGQGALFPRGQMMGGLLSTGLAAAPLIGQVAQDVGQGRTLDAAVTGGVGGGILAATEVGGRALGGVKGGLLRTAGAVLAPLIGNAAGNFAEGMRAEDTGVAPAGASEVEERKADRAKTKQNAQDQLAIQVNAMNANMAGIKDFMAAAGDQQITNMQRQMPLIAMSQVIPH